MMYYFRTYLYILIAAAVIPAIFIVRFVYKADRKEKEPPRLIVRLIIGGIISTVVALIWEKIGIGIIDRISMTDAKYYFVMFFLLVGPAEEISKYIFLKKISWRDPSFNCQFDAIVYSVSVSLGFALFENVKYVLSYGFSTALIRAVTAIPGHASFGVFMGVWYGVAKRQEVLGNVSASKLFRVIALITPILIHGAYDYIATVATDTGSYLFIIFIGALFFITYKVVKRLSAKDRYLDPNHVSVNVYDVNQDNNHNMQ